MDKELENKIQSGMELLIQLSKQLLAWHILLKLSSVECKKKILKFASKKSQLVYRATTVRLKGDLSQESTCQQRMKWYILDFKRAAKYILPSKASLCLQKMEENTPQQTKAQRIHYPENCEETCKR